MSKEPMCPHCNLPFIEGGDEGEVVNGARYHSWCCTPSTYSYKQTENEMSTLGKSLMNALGRFFCF